MTSLVMNMLMRRMISIVKISDDITCDKYANEENDKYSEDIR